MKLDFKTVLKPALILCLICFCVSALLAVTNELTKETIALAALQKEEQSRQLALPIADRFEKIDANSYTAFSGDEKVGYVFSTESKGYSGAVKVMTGIDSEGMITGIIILAQTETPGLGSNCERESFTDMYKQKATKLEVVKNQGFGDGKIEAMTGATITTDAVTVAVNEAVSLYENIVGEENG